MKKIFHPSQSKRKRKLGLKTLWEEDDQGIEVQAEANVATIESEQKLKTKSGGRKNS